MGLRPRLAFRHSAPRDRGRRGATAVEMALIAPIFFLLFMGMMELSLVMLVQHLMENSTYNASRLAKTGFVTAGKTQEETVLAALHKELGSLAPLIDVSKVTMTSTAYGQLSDIDQPGQGVQSLGTPEQIVVYTVSYPWKFFTPMVGKLMGDENYKLTLTARIVVRNEPY